MQRDFMIPETYTSFIESDAQASSKELRAAMAETGYLFFRDLVPQDVVLEVRRDVLEVCREAGWLDESHDLMEGVVNPDVEPVTERHDEYRQVYRKVLKLPRFHAFPCNAALMQIAEKLLAENVLVHPRRIGRMAFPNYTVATTPPHQDHHYIRGTVETYSCWVPLGDCPRELGGLAVWPGSHHRGFIEHTVHFPGAVGSSGVPFEESEAVWHNSDFRTGDALFFHSYAIHKALPNLSGNRLRLSTDNRYQREQDDIHPGALLPHLNLN